MKLENKINLKIKHTKTQNLTDLKLPRHTKNTALFFGGWGCNLVVQMKTLKISLTN